MKNLTIDNIANACEGHIIASEYDTNVTAKGVVLDSRLVEPGFVFVCTVGERVDGHSFALQVQEKGAIAIICEHEVEGITIPQIIVEDSFKALTAVATYYRSQIDTKIVGITGSVGKTSTKEFVAGVLSAKYNVLKTNGNFNNEIGVPLTILRIQDEHDVAVVEMGINHFGEMTRLTNVARPDKVVITNIGTCHLEYLEDRDGVLKAKTEIFAGLSKDGEVFLNGDDDKLITVKEVNGTKPIFFGLDKENNNWSADSITDKGLFGSECDIKSDTGVIIANANIPLPGKHMIYNALVASAVATSFGLTSDEIKKGLASVKAVGGRSNIIRTDKYTLIDDCYNANPVSTKAAIDLLMLANTRKVAILGDMFELGENEKALHKEVGEYAASKEVDVVIAIGSLSKSLYEGATVNQEAESKKEVHYFATKEEAMDKLTDILHDGDSILIKASHGMAFVDIVSKLS